MSVPQFFSHPVSPFSRRVAYALAFKGITVEVVEVDLLHPSPEFLAVSDTCAVPALKVTCGESSFNLVESLVILEYLEGAYGGPALYPRTPSGGIDPVAKALLDADIRNHVETVIPAIKKLGPGGTDKDKADLKSKLRKLNDEYLAGGQHFASAKLGVDQVTVGDLALLPVIEFVDAFKGAFLADVATSDLTNLWAWFRRMNAQPWVQRHYLGPQATRKYIQMVTSGQYAKLTLPVSLYY